jgi:FG-GAP-like repeat
VTKSAFRWVILALVVAWSCGQTPEPGNDSRSAILPPGPPAAFLTSRPIGEPIRGDERPRIANVQVIDLDRDGLADVLACDALKNTVVWIRQVSKDVYTETSLADIPAPAHAEVIDIDRDGDLDVVVAALGVLMPSNNRVGSIVILENDGRQHFTKHVIADQIARVADARAGDLDGDGDLDLAIAGFGYDDGETSWFENKGNWTFEQHVLQRLSGPINAIIADINRDGAPDIVALVSQEWEEIWAFLNDGRGHFTARMIWGSTNADFGSSWISLLDMDGDGDIDILYSNGDAFDYAPPNSRPWQGVQWLENQGGMSFAFHRIADLQGASSPQAVDLDGDGDLDVVVVTANNDWNDPMAPSLVWLENNGRLQFAPHAVASSPTHLITLAVGDLDGDGQPDLVAGGMHISRPYDRMARVTAWWNRYGTPQRR